MGSAAEVPPGQGPRWLARLGAALAIAASLAAIAAGCGGDAASSKGGDGSAGAIGQTSSQGTEATTPATSMTKARYVAWLNHVCRRSWPTILHNVAEYRGWQKRNLSRKEQIEQTIRYSYMAGFDYYVFSKVIAWGPPGEHRHGGKRMINAMKKAAEDGLHRVWIGSLEELTAVFADYNRIAQQYGVDQCLVAGPHIPRL
jgi:hypothetical protein